MLHWCEGVGVAMFEVSHDLNCGNAVVVLFVVSAELLCYTSNSSAGMVKDSDVFVGVVCVVVCLDCLAYAVKFFRALRGVRYGSAPVGVVVVGSKRGCNAVEE